MSAPAYFTADMVRALPDDGNRYEVVYGELLVTPAPRLWHQEVAIRLLRAIGDYLDGEPVGHLLQSPADISWGPDILVQPDLFVAPLAQVRTLDWTQVKDLSLVIEVLSPSLSASGCCGTRSAPHGRSCSSLGSCFGRSKSSCGQTVNAPPETRQAHRRPCSRRRNAPRSHCTR